MRRKDKLIRAAVLAGLSSAAGTASAADNFWTGSGGTDWNTPGNWSTNQVPTNTAEEDAVVNINTPNVATISADLVATPRDIFVGREAGSTGRVNHTAGTAGTGNGNWMFIGARAGGTGTYNLTGSTATAGNLTGFNLGSGNLNVGGTDAGAGRLYVGGDHVGTGNGTFNVNTSGTLKIGNDLGVGSAGGTGVMNVDAGTITTAGWNFIGKNEVSGGANGTLNMAGGVLQNTGRTYVGQTTTTGKLILTGGTYNNNNNEQFIIGEGTGSNGLVEVKSAASTLKSTGELWVGQAAGGNGTLNVSAGSVPVNNWLVAGRDGATGVINLSGGTISKAGGGGVPIGTNGGNGTINVTGGTFTIAEPLFADNAAEPGNLDNFSNDLILGELNNGNGTVVQTAGTVSVGGDLRLAGKLPTETGGSGTYRLRGGTLDMTGGAIIPGGGTPTLEFSGGRLANAASIALPLGLAQTGGTLAPGPSAGTTAVAGAYSLTAGTYEADLIGGGTSSDLLSITGVATLGGTLDVVPNGSLAVGTSYTILTAGSLVGQFANAPAGAFSQDGVNYLISYGNNSVTLTVQPVPEPAGAAVLGLAAAAALGRRRRRRRLAD